MSPVNSELFTAPSVNVPPGSRLSAFESFVYRVNWNVIRGLSSVPGVLTSVCQKGVACEDAISSKARPINPERGAFRSCAVVRVTKAIFGSE